MEERFTLLSVMATFCMQSCLCGINGRNNGKTRVGVGWTGFCNWGNAAWSMKSKPLDGCSLIESCSPVLLTWRFVAVMNIVEVPWAARYSAAAQPKVDSKTLDGWIFVFCSTT